MEKMERNLSHLEKTFLLEFLEELSDRFSNDGCNDFELPNTPEHHLLMYRVIDCCFSPEDAKDEKEHLRTSKSKIYTMNTLILGYLQKCVKQLPSVPEIQALL